MTEPIFTIANQLTMLRMALVPPFVLLVLDRQYTWALVVYVVAAATDALDGWVARHAHQSTRLGQMLDPVADKLLAGAAYLLLTWGPGLSCALPAWLTVSLLFRDAMIVVSVVIVNLAVGPRTFAPSVLGKVSTAFNFTTGTAVLAANATGDCPRALLWLYVVTLLFVVASTIHYVYQASEKSGRERDRDSLGSPGQS